MTKAKFSPATETVLNAVGAKPSRPVHCASIAAAIRAAANELKPKESCEIPGILAASRQLLIIADELERVSRKYTFFNRVIFSTHVGCVGCGKSKKLPPKKVHCFVVLTIQVKLNEEAQKFTPLEMAC